MNDNEVKYLEIKSQYLSLKSKNNKLDFSEEEAIFSELEKKENVTVDDRYAVSKIVYSDFNEKLDKLEKLLNDKRILISIDDLNVFIRKNYLNEENRSLDSLNFVVLESTIIDTFKVIEERIVVTEKFLDDFFECVYQVIKLEIINNSFESKLLEEVQKYPFCSKYVEKSLLNELKEINKSTFVSERDILKNMNEYIEMCGIMGVNGNILDKRMFIGILILTKKDLVKDAFNELVNEYNTTITNNNSKIGNSLIDIKEIEDYYSQKSYLYLPKLKRLKSGFLERRQELKRRLTSLALASSLFLGVGVATNYVIRESNKQTLYETQTETYYKEGDEEVIYTSTESYAPKVNREKTLIVVEPIYFDDKGIMRRVRYTYDVDNVFLDNVLDYIDLKTITPGVEQIKEERGYAYDDVFEGKIIELQVVTQNLDVSKENFNKQSYKTASGISALIIFLLSLIPHMPTNLLYKLYKFYKQCYLPDSKEYKSLLEDIKSFIKEADVYVKDNESIKESYNTLCENGLEVFLNPYIKTKIEVNLSSENLQDLNEIKENLKSLEL